MRILDRHILRECGLASALATTAFMFVLVAGNILQQVIGAVAAGRVDPWQALQLVGLLFPTVIPYALPMGVLTGILMTFGRMGAEGEITAMKSAGLSLWRVASPVWLALGLILPLCLWLNLDAGPNSEARFQEIVVGSATRNPAAVIVPGKLNQQFKGLLIKAGDKDGDVLKDFWLWQGDAQGSVYESLYADEARVVATFDAQGAPILRVNLKDPRVMRHDWAPRPEGKSVTHSLAAGTILEFPREDSSKAAFVKRLRMMTGGDLWRAMETGWQVTPNATEAERAKERTVLRTQLMFRVATAISVLSLAFLAVPLAVSVGRSEVNVNAALALAVSLGYYVLTSAASWVKSPSLHPEVLVILPNVVLIGIAFVLMRRAVRY